MKNKTAIKMAIDIAMTLLIIACMAGIMTGETLHEIFGSSMVVLFLLHNILNYKWFANLFTGKYTSVRIFWIAINLLCLITLLAQGVSGVFLSNHLYTFLNINFGISVARNVHLACGYWSFVLIALHLGLHWAMIMSRIGLNKIQSKPVIWTLRIIAFIISGFGIYAFIKNQLWSYMILINHFAFFDYEQPLVFFYAEYISIMTLFASLGYWCKKLLGRLKS